MNRIKGIINSISQEFHRTFTDDAQLLLFGSRANDTHHAYSDIDLAIQHGGALNKNKLNQFYDFVDNLPTLYSIDLVNMTNASGALKRQIKGNSILL